MIEDFVRVFRKSSREFESYDTKEKMEILFGIMQDERLLKGAIEEIKSDERDVDGGNIFLNLISLMPFSFKIVEEFLKSSFLEDEDIYRKLDVVFRTNSKILDILQKFKQYLRDQNFKSVKLDEKLNEVNRELKKYEETIKKSGELDKKRKELANKVGGEKKLQEMQKELQKLEEAVAKYKSLKNEVEQSKKSFKELLKDES